MLLYFLLTNTIWTDQLWSCPTKLYNILIGRGLLIPASQKRVFFYLYGKLREGKICWQILKVWLTHSDFCKSDVRYLSQRKQQRDRGFTQLYGQKFYCPRSQLFWWQLLAAAKETNLLAVCRMGFPLGSSTQMNLMTLIRRIIICNLEKYTCMLHRPNYWRLDYIYYIYKNMEVYGWGHGGQQENIKRVLIKQWE